MEIYACHLNAYKPDIKMQILSLFAIYLFLYYLIKSVKKLTFYLFILSIRTGCMFDVASHAVVFRGHTSPKEGTLGVRHYCGLRYCGLVVIYIFFLMFWFFQLGENIWVQT